MCAVSDTHCAEYPPDIGHGLRPPTLDEHMDIPGSGKDNGKRISRLSHFTVHLNQRIGLIGFELRILVGHLHSQSAPDTYGAPAKQTYYEEAARVIAHYETYVYCTDANMSLIETRDCMTAAWHKTFGLGRHPRMSVAAWFPYHFVNAIKEPKKFKTRPREGLGIDSMGMFYITHGEKTPAQAAWVEPDIRIDSIEELVAAESAETRSREAKHYGFPRHVYQQFSPKSAYPGQHCSLYRFFASRMTFRDQLKRFLEPHTSCGVFMRLEHPDLYV